MIFLLKFYKCWKVIMDMVGVDKLVEEVKMKLEEVNKKLVKEYNDFL